MRVEILFNKQSKITDSLFPLLEHELRKRSFQNIQICSFVLPLVA